MNEYNIERTHKQSDLYAYLFAEFNDKTKEINYNPPNDQFARIQRFTNGLNLVCQCINMVGYFTFAWRGCFKADILTNTT
ncbi:hypothetical protein [Helicobacter ibis]|uniref:Uncharacterized protein n=1 Tax=Helicobacter ibis TaxID=2962633 RepID=A0ABT4VCE3_9HELI|nr:hypothetical protein [Helicobacter ibis]MDA3968371.1 hypothetical protein [Helicobacter ibis]